jgi:hypothetical protein
MQSTIRKRTVTPVPGTLPGMDPHPCLKLPECNCSRSYAPPFRRPASTRNWVSR